ncbi:L,D-transpeptidase [Rugosimonospora africana]|uniref:L,D-transpeptidase n=1 Tax=Rugosimonospora africana TaxID=556532 RepID=UPI001EF18AF1|nr:Ig-like domain-containing protein [Rugosimonospora africana]
MTLTDATDKRVSGALRSDGAAWVPAQPLAYHTTYHATVTVVDGKGTRSTVRTNFTTMPQPAGDPIVSTLDLQSGATYGVGMPLALRFDAPIPDDSKAEVEHRLSVTSDPPQTGVWHWYGDQQVIYRPKSYWQPGTRLAVSTKLGGMPVAGRYLDSDHTAAATIGRKMTFRTTDATKRMQVFQNDKLVKTFPVSLGAPETPSSAGNMVIMTRERSVLWVYSDDDQLEVSYAEQLTGDGEYIHAAPWSVADQGHDDVSHGCTNLSTDDAAWVYNNSLIGDPVTVNGTGKHLQSGNGWTVWDTSWDDYAKGSALRKGADRPPAEGQAPTGPKPPPMRMTK